MEVAVVERGTRIDVDELDLVDRAIAVRVVEQPSLRLVVDDVVIAVVGKS
jgi:hypothetical protein